MFTNRSITQKYLRRWPDSQRAQAWAGKTVHIRTENGIWRPDAHGYTYNLTEAWEIPFEQAVQQISHCGPEKRGTFILAGSQPNIT
jgi:hypothetical protein